MGGILTNDELIDSLLVDVNALPRLLFDGQYIVFCSKIGEIGVKLANLKKGVASDLENKNMVIEQLKAQLRESGVSVEDIPVDEYVRKYTKKDGG